MFFFFVLDGADIFISSLDKKFPHLVENLFYFGLEFVLHEVMIEFNLTIDANITKLFLSPVSFVQVSIDEHLDV